MAFVKYQKTFGNSIKMQSTRAMELVVKIKIISSK